jgi:prolyl oligopeptidase
MRPILIDTPCRQLREGWQYRPTAGRVALLVALLQAGPAVEVAAAPVPIVYPAAPRGAVIDDFHGTKVADPYRWLEDLDAPATRAWVRTENALTDAYFGRLPARAALRARLGLLYDFESFGVPFAAGRRLLYERNTGLQNQSVLFRTESLNGQSSVLLDPNSLSKDGSLVVVGYVASADGRFLAYGVSVSGSDWTDWHVRNLAAGRDLPDVIRNTKYYPPSFAKDGNGLYYSAFPAPAPGAELSAQDLGNAVYYHALGTPAATDHKLLEFTGHTDWQYEPTVSEDGRWLIVTSGEGEVGDKGLVNLYLIDLAPSAKVVTTVSEGFRAAYIYVGADAGRLYFLTTRAAPNGKVIAVDPTAATTARISTVIAEGPDAIELTEPPSTPSVTLIDHQLIVQQLHDAHSRVLTYGLDGKLRHTVVLPGPGTVAGFTGRSVDKQTFYSFTDLITPPSIYLLDLASGKSTVYRAPKVAFDSNSFEEKQVFYPGKDGTRIPMLLAYRKGLKPDGTNPVLLYGYGGFSIPLLPEFGPAKIAWLEMGGVYGEYGEHWHLQGNRAHKQVVFEDFISAAEWLIHQHYTQPAKLAIMGASNGGLLIGACITQRPELYGAAIAKVGVMDMLRFDLFGQGAGWTGEYGSPHEPADFRVLYAYSPLHNVRAGTRYPATLIITGDHDTRVMPAHSFKFAAALQAAQAGPEPELLYLEKSSGHGGGPTLSQAIEQNADIYAFLADRLSISLGR